MSFSPDRLTLRTRPAVAAGLLAVLLGACSFPERPGGSDDSGRPNAVVSTEILADLVRHVGGDRVNVQTVIPPGGDPHSFEPSPKDARTVAGADVAFTNHLLLEEHALIKMFDSNVGDGVPNISLAEHAEQYGAGLIPLVEDVDIDTIWLGLAVRGKSPNRSDDIELRATALDGPGELSVYLTETLGEPNAYFTSADGLGENDVAVLPPAAHTHVNWAFTAPGEYRLTFAATLRSDGTATPVGSGTFTFAVGVDPHAVPRGPAPRAGQRAHRPGGRPRHPHDRGPLRRPGRPGGGGHGDLGAGRGH